MIEETVESYNRTTPLDIGLQAKLLAHLGPPTTISGLMVTMLQSSLVYAWRRGDRWLYVGCSAQGIARPLGSSHHVIGKRGEVRPDDQIDIWRFASYDEAATVEYELRHLFMPQLNGRLSIEMKPRLLSECVTLPPFAVMAAALAPRTVELGPGETVLIRAKVTP